MAAALRGTAEVDWQGFYERYTRGHDPLPLDNVFQVAGLKLGETANDWPLVTLDPAASAVAKTLWAGFIK